MAKIGNEAKLILKLALERMKAERMSWQQSSLSNPHSDASNKDWLRGYEYAWSVWCEELFAVANEIEGK